MQKENRSRWRGDEWITSQALCSASSKVTDLKLCSKQEDWAGVLEGAGWLGLGMLESEACQILYAQLWILHSTAINAL